MKIEGQLPKVPVQEKGIQKGNEKVQVESQKSASVKKALADQFTVKKLRAKIEAEPDMDLKKIQEIKDKIKGGTYQIDNETLAGKLLEDSLLEDLS